MILSSPMTKIRSADDVAAVASGKCLTNQGFQFQACFVADADISLPVTVSGSLASFVRVYRVRDVRGKFDSSKKNDDYYYKTDDDMYPDILVPADSVEAKAGEQVVLFVDVSEREKPAGRHVLAISVGNERASLTLDVEPAVLVPTDLIVTHWLYADCICDRYGVEPFGDEFYRIFDSFLDYYVRMGNNTMLLPAFTVPLDTKVGAERTTTQLVGVDRSDGKYRFDFSAMRKFVRVCRAHGIVWFEHSHMFSQWGAEFCPKIVVRENGEAHNEFGWNVRSEDPAYMDFLREYFKAFLGFVREEGLFDYVFLHVSDEPRPGQVEHYGRLLAAVREFSGGLKVMDTFSTFEGARASAADMPVIIMNSPDLPLFDSHKMLYYCVGVDGNYITNHFLHMPLQRTEILGLQLYENDSRGFLNWAFNFYNAALSVSRIDPFADMTSAGGLPAGDAFIVYPGPDGAWPSLRYFALKRAFEDYRLLLTAEQRLGRNAVLDLLHANGVHGVHEYPRSVAWHENFRAGLITAICK